MTTPYIGEIRMFGGNFAPVGWALCDGSLLSTNENDALFSLLGTIYGGDGRTTFALPDLRGRIPIHYGEGPGLTNRSIGTKSGTETITLADNQIPAHTHMWEASTNTADQTTVSNHVLGSNASVDIFEQNLNNPIQMSDQAIAAHSGSGSSQPNLMPYQVVNFIIALIGIYPSQT
ncbi:phage tail protein [Leptothoe spongobia]|uniref:Phage tail protein n=1 Tax=Leptothoe spongobia TAU-MAC 1115 TaxID=1967444 RepID=A0A947DBH1_9CYAN|nr:tail fiber protein [Leptothoe spongobia]MBT9314087.1 phage tail protein [Leptothoe spongobia TAU-MAC 1115]